MGRSLVRSCKFDPLLYLVLLSFSLGLGIGWLFFQPYDSFLHKKDVLNIKDPVLDIINLHRRYDYNLSPLEWSDDLVYAASKLAYVQTGSQPSLETAPIGVALGSRTINTTRNDAPFSSARAIVSIIDEWRTESVLVNVTDGLDMGNREKIRAYSQIMSPDTTKVGCIWNTTDSDHTIPTWTLYCAFNSLGNHIIDATGAVLSDEGASCIDCTSNSELFKRDSTTVSDIWSGNPLPGSVNWYLFATAIRAYINHYRAKVGAEPLQWYDPLNDRAISRANQCGGMYYLADDTSQSLYIIGNVNDTTIDFSEQTYTGVDYWWSRGFLLNDTAADNYDTQNMLDSFDYIHMVWKSSQYISCAWSETPCPNLEPETTDDAYLLWCEFYPPGGEELYYFGNVTRPDTTGP